MCQWAANRNPWVVYRIGLSVTPTCLITLQTGGRGVEKTLFKIAAKRLEIDENVKTAHFRTHWLAVK